jgi:hypothetical protein
MDPEKSRSRIRAGSSPAGHISGPGIALKKTGASIENPGAAVSEPLNEGAAIRVQQCAIL